MKIIYTIAGLYRPAGMERILTAKANYLSRHGYEVVIVTTEQKGRPSAFALDKGVRCVDLGIGYEDNNGASLWDKLIHYPGKHRRHKKALRDLLYKERPRITVSMFCGDEDFLPSVKDGSKKILEVHFSRFKRLQYGRGGLWAFADRCRSRQESRFAARFDRFVTLTQEDYHNWGAPANALFIPNFLEHYPPTTADLESKVVLAVGRFSHQKAFSRLIESWYRATLELGPGHGWQLLLVGSGELKAELQNQIHVSGLDGCARILEPTTEIDTVYRNASIMALSSRYEGLPMVLLEAQSYGIPAVAFDCKCGPRDVILDGEDGFLIPEGDTDAFARALVKLIQDDKLRLRMGDAARKNSSRWDKEKIMKQWTDLFCSI